ncbi:hypothetical protein SAMN05421751_1083 [Jhaorihella thermophila]|uniref:Uncharacterized protein n=1 Tax=Jhaorihella thermophila TaxID=488547 RepID=A0A1H5WFV7_9RHOB|nr:hypothetical protein SAMN05421751_1083 [Jhaorihella thermophila]
MQGGSKEGWRISLRACPGALERPIWGPDKTSE